MYIKILEIYIAALTYQINCIYQKQNCWKFIKRVSRKYEAIPAIKLSLKTT